MSAGGMVKELSRDPDEAWAEKNMARFCTKYGIGAVLAVRNRSVLAYAGKDENSFLARFSYEASKKGYNTFLVVRVRSK